MLARMVLKSLTRNTRTSFWMLASLASCAALVALFTTIALEVENKMTSALRHLGANAVVYPASSKAQANAAGAATESDWRSLEEIARRHGAEVVRLRLRVGLARNLPVAVVAAAREGLQAMTPYWSIAGRRTTAAGECIAGSRLAKALSLKVGGDVEVEWPEGGPNATFEVVGILESGDEDEDRLFVDAHSSGDPAASPAAFTYALLSASGGGASIDRLQDALRTRGVALGVKPLRQVLHGETAVLERINLLSGVALSTVIALTLMGVSAAMLARVAERRKELALLQALGARCRSVIWLLLTESAVIGTAASVLGFGAGTLLADGVAESVFGVSMSPQWTAFAASFVVATLVAVLSSSFGCGRALRIPLATALRGE